ncbi:zinc finger (AN1-like) family protein [Striga asiatica]|uniref:Zinc finger (AN1-like) family protein n=1 Tax=Striga asiatica TaxID=4170 RepID=A0A5A7QF74_STRAF|nr:zinc finger (AN1-like) family protein [Striga asiatica]
MERDGEDEKKVLERQEKSSQCDARKKKKPTCPISRCRRVLTFSNTTTCENCCVKICLSRRFLTDHSCEWLRPASVVVTLNNTKFMVALGLRSGLKAAWVDEAGGRASTRQRRSLELNIQCLHGEQRSRWLSGTSIQKVDGRPNCYRSVGAARSLKGRP